MWVRVIPVSPGPVTHLEFVNVNFTRSDGIARVAVHVGGNMQAVPMDDALFRKLVDEVNSHFLTSLHPYDWTQVRVQQVLQIGGIAFEQLTIIAPHTRGDARQDRYLGFDST